MTINVYSGFTKRRNSTKQPTGGTQVTCTLKEATSIEHPTFVLTSNDFTINYVNAFGAYYFVDDIKSVRNGIIEISCSKDCGATYKTEIGSYTAFIERCASSSTAMLPDPMLGMLSSEQTDKAVKTMAYFNYVGFYVISVLNDLGSGVGFTTYYVFDVANMERLAAYLNVDWGGTIGGATTPQDALNNILQWFQATFLHTSDSIVNCIWLPLQSSLLTAADFSSETVKIGVDVVTGVTAKRFTSVSMYSFETYLAIPHRYTDFRKGAPYTTVKLYLPGYGDMEINPLDFSSDIVYIEYNIDVATGDTAIFLRDNYKASPYLGKTISIINCNIAVQCPVGHVTVDATRVTSGVISTAAKIATASNPVTAGVAGLASAINSVANAMAPTSSVHGSLGGRALFYAENEIMITTIAKDTLDPADLTHDQGNIYMKRGTISSYSGFIKCQDASVPIAGEAADKEAVNALLNGGFYYE